MGDLPEVGGGKQGKAAGLEFEWTINVANADPARQAANIDDLITAGGESWRKAVACRVRSEGQHLTTSRGFRNLRLSSRLI